MYETMDAERRLEIKWWIIYTRRDALVMSVGDVDLVLRVMRVHGKSAKSDLCDVNRVIE